VSRFPVGAIGLPLCDLSESGRRKGCDNRTPAGNDHITDCLPESVTILSGSIMLICCSNGQLIYRWWFAYSRGDSRLRGQRGPRLQQGVVLSADSGIQCASSPAGEASSAFCQQTSYSLGIQVADGLPGCAPRVQPAWRGDLAGF
jgi:hypothetical protein